MDDEVRRLSGERPRLTPYVVRPSSATRRSSGDRRYRPRPARDHRTVELPVRRGALQDDRAVVSSQPCTTAVRTELRRHSRPSSCRGSSQGSTSPRRTRTSASNGSAHRVLAVSSHGHDARDRTARLCVARPIRPCASYSADSARPPPSPPSAVRASRQIHSPTGRRSRLMVRSEFTKP